MAQPPAKQELDSSDVPDNLVPATSLPTIELDPIVVDAFGNVRDCAFILRIDAQIERFVSEPDVRRMELAPMSSYHRLILHRIADYYGIEHLSLLKEDGQRCIVYQKADVIPFRHPSISEIQKQAKSPAASAVSGDPSTSSPMCVSSRPPPKMKIMRRPAPAAASKSSTNVSGDASDMPMSLEQREQAYAEARAKIFQDSNQNADIPPEIISPTDVSVDPNNRNTWDIEPHEQPLYDRSRYNRCRAAPPPVLPLPYSVPPPPPPLHTMYPPPRPPLYPSSQYPPVLPQHPYYHPAMAQRSMYGSQQYRGDWSSPPPVYNRPPPPNPASFSTLEVYDLPSGIKNYEVDVLLEGLKRIGCSIQWLNGNHMVAVFHSPEAAEHALRTVQDPRFKLRRPLLRQYPAHSSHNSQDFL